MTPLVICEPSAERQFRGLTHAEPILEKISLGKSNYFDILHIEHYSRVNACRLPPHSQPGFWKPSHPSRRALPGRHSRRFQCRAPVRPPDARFLWSETEDELRLAASIIGFSFQALEALGQAAAPDRPITRTLRLRGGAVSLNRACQKPNAASTNSRKPAGRTFQSNSSNDTLISPSPN